MKHFVGTGAYAPYASINIPPSPSFFLAEALLKLLHQKKRILNDPQVLTDAALNIFLYFITRLYGVSFHRPLTTLTGSA